MHASFFLSGEHEVLARHASSFLPWHLQHVGMDLLQHMLFHQYVSFAGSIFQVTIGSGMGFQCSGEVASAAFIREVEERTLPKTFGDKIMEFCGMDVAMMML